MPSNLKNPAWLAEQAELLAAEAGLDLPRLGRRAAARRGLRRHHRRRPGLGHAAAADPPRLHARPRPTRRTPTVVLVGKGITFDTGGISIKPAAGHGRDEARHDRRRRRPGDDGRAGRRRLPGQASSASSRPPRTPSPAAPPAPATCCATTAAAPPRSPTPTPRAAWSWPTPSPTPSPSSTRPRSSTSPPSPAASRSRWASRSAGCSPTTTPSPTRCSASGETAGEPLWRFPLLAGYEDKLASKVADADNGPGGPGAIMAALFLQHFVGDVPWAHLDIASVGDAPEDSYEWTEGPTGFGARALLTWLGSADPLAGVGADREVADHPLVARRRARRRRGGAGVVRRVDLPRPLHRHGRAALQDLAGAPGRVVRGPLRLRRPTRRAPSSSETFTDERRRRRPAPRSSAARRS